jgi:hypothetical protein
MRGGVTPPPLLAGGLPSTNNQSTADADEPPTIFLDRIEQPW